MVGRRREVSTPLLENILHQPDALRSVSAWHFGDGRQALEKAAHFLRDKKGIVLSGMGASCFATVPFQYLLGTHGFEVTSTETAELLHFPMSSVRGDKAVVLVSRSGESIEVIKLLERLHESGTPVLGIANIPDSTLLAQADHSLLLQSPPDQLVAIQTYTATVAVFALLQAAVVGELEQARGELDQTIQLLDASIPQWVKARDQWRPFLDGTAPLYLLGRGSSLGAVAEGVLLIHETSKAPAIGMSVPQFRHGPVEVVDRDFRAVILGTQPATVNLDSALASDLTGMGGQVRWLGPAVADSTAQPLCPWPDNVPARFASLVEVIPLQILAYQKAENRGIRPGDFRWAPTITSSESGFPQLQP